MVDPTRTTPQDDMRAFVAALPPADPALEAEARARLAALADQPAEAPWAGCALGPGHLTKPDRDFSRNT